MKTNHDLGLKIHALLKKNNLENNAVWKTIDLWHDEQYRKELDDKLTDFIQHLGLNLDDTSLACTPKRMTKLFLDDLFWGLDYRNFPDISSDDNSFEYKSPLISKHIAINSTCEHHFVTFKGYTTVVYIPNKKIIGLGKINQVVSFFAHRPQLQERLTRQIFIVLKHLLDTEDVAVFINARHDCISRHEKTDKSNEILSFELGGKFLSDKALNNYFYNLAIA